ncbi:MAG TPA: OsmC family protein [Bacteroidota bacterium]|nr:OsmC family protein [Bacteroidota bacterium]
MNQAIGTSQPNVRYKSFRYQTGLRWLGNKAGELSSADKPSFRVASPPEFKGEAGVWTPEDLFVAAVDICTMTTFMAFAQRLQLPIVSYSSSAEGILEFVDGGYRFTKVVLRPRIVVSTPEAIEQVRRTLHDAHESCLIANSIRADVVVEPTVTHEQETDRYHD